MTSIPSPHGTLASKCRSGDDAVLSSLIERVGAGDIHAFEVLYEALAPTVYGISLQVAHDSARAQDIAKDVFLKLWSEAGKFDFARNSVRLWAIRLASHHAADEAHAFQVRRVRHGLSRLRDT